MAAEAQLKYIEWGSDLHAPVGRIERAQEIGTRTRAAGLEVSSYGSYYRVGADGVDNPPFASVLETALALGTKTIRVWAGNRPSRSAYDSHWKQLISETQEIAGLAEKDGVDIAFEFHGNTMNDTTSATRRLLERVERENVGTFWQIDGRNDYETCLRGLRRVREWLRHIHVFHWHEGQRRPLDEAEGHWETVLEAAAKSGRDHIALLELVQDDSISIFQNDARTLKKIVKRVNRALARENRQPESEEE